MYDEKQKEWTPEQLSEAAQDAVNNWEWEYPDVEGLDGRLEIAKALADPDYDKSSYADDDGIIRIGRGFKDVWEWLYEQIESTWASSLLQQ